VEEKAAQERTQAEIETLARVIEDLKKTTDKFAAQIPILEEKVKHLDNKVLDKLTEARAKELSLEGVAKANEDYKSENVRLTKKLESKLSLPLSPELCIFLNVYLLLLLLLSSLLTLPRHAESDAELNTLKAMVENIVAFF
jgi:uncharacterized coiled-coil protein SlyX